MLLKSTHFIIFYSKSTHYKIIPLFFYTPSKTSFIWVFVWCQCFSDLMTQARNLPYHEPQHKTQPQHTTTKANRHRLRTHSSASSAKQLAITKTTAASASRQTNHVLPQVEKSTGQNQKWAEWKTKITKNPKIWAK